MSDPINHPEHYTSSGAHCPDCGRTIECIDVTEHMGFLRGNAIKYLWRAGLKGDALEDLRKARWYVDRAIAREEAKRAALRTPGVGIPARVTVARKLSDDELSTLNDFWDTQCVEMGGGA